MALNSARGKARDARRRGDLRQLATSLELNYNDNSNYPSTAGAWWGNCSSYGSHGLTGANGYIPNLAPGYLAQLPIDPKYNGPGGCYLYQSNGVNYKLLVHGTTESLCPVPSADSMYDPARPGQCTFAIYTPGAVGW